LERNEDVLQTGLESLDFPLDQAGQQISIPRTGGIEPGKIRKAIVDDCIRAGRGRVGARSDRQPGVQQSAEFANNGIEHLLHAINLRGFLLGIPAKPVKQGWPAAMNQCRAAL
jgi:hypothetical protein